MSKDTLEAEPFSNKEYKILKESEALTTKTKYKKIVIFKEEYRLATSNIKTTKIIEKYRE
jgi:hypothetical protein